MNFLYTFIALVLITLVYGAWSRRKIYKDVDRLESKKVQLMNEPVTEELSKIKGLKMSGETEERFEQWREVWDEIVTIQLPDIEEKLFDIEDLANKYRFGKAKQLVRFVDEEMEKLSEHLQEMMDEVEHLVNSEEQNRLEIHSVKDAFQETKKRLWAQRGSLGVAGAEIERRLKDGQELFQAFEDETNEGNYLQAREVLLRIKEELEFINETIGKAPRYLVLMEKELPRQLEELEKGFAEMEEQGFSLEHFSFKWQTEEMKRRLIALVPLVESLKLKEVDEPLEAFQKEIEEIYDKLEQEAMSRQQLERELPLLAAKLEELPHRYEKLEREIETVKLSYRISEEEDRKQWKMEKQMKDILNQFSVIRDSMEENKQSFTSLSKLAEEFAKELALFEENLEEAGERLAHLRRDERSAEDTIRELKEKLVYGHKKLKRSNLPGVPETLLIELDEAEKALLRASEKLNELPISIDEVMLKVDEAKKHVEVCVNKLMTVIEKASLAEGVIQYGNRYRRHYDDINIQLLQAENLFRQYLYEEALEKAVTAIEAVDPEVLKKVSENELLQPLND
ncbi:septation ring formation regulator [Evansella caseinilytica]|uniref:Septation ring formation regulator EzrA n=1 Tax=Evansella caseinilytica TaxID=1503961 RepID=A0A1H3RRY3_9BACI|nr:septation ring formation regulator EzrA [Evansella caseinilytica]SDZ28370.1 septation ring formation regulator [Evansella caseinilytica]